MSAQSEPHYAPPPGLPPPSTQYAPPQGAPPPSTQYAPSTNARELEDDQTAPVEPPPPYSKNPTTPIADLSGNRIQFTTLPAYHPASPDERPLDPPPACFSSPTPLRVHSHSFAPFRVPSINANLASGFQPIYPPQLLEPHGISAADWARFLHDLRVAAVAALNGQSVISGYAAGVRMPSAVLGILGGPKAASGGPYDRTFARTPVDEVKALIEVWQGSAFERRKLRVSLHVRAEEGGGRRAGYDLLVEAL